MFKKKKTAWYFLHPVKIICHNFLNFLTLTTLHSIWNNCHITTSGVDLWHPVNNNPCHTHLSYLLFHVVSFYRPSRMMLVSGYGSSSSFSCVHFHSSSWIGIITDINHLWIQEEGKKEVPQCATGMTEVGVKPVEAVNLFLPTETILWVQLFCIYKPWTLCIQLGVSHSATHNSSVTYQWSNLDSNRLCHHLVCTQVSHWQPW